MCEERITPPGVRTLIPPAPDTPLPPANLNPEYADDLPKLVASSDDETSEDVDVDVNVDVHLQMPPMIQVTPYGIDGAVFARLRRISQYIIRDEANGVVDPSSFECPSGECGYCTGDPWLQRFLLMKRLYQLNACLVGGAGQENAQEVD